MQRFLLVFSLLSSNVFFTQTRLNLIPYPQKVEFLQGEFNIPKHFILDKNLPKGETEYFKKHFAGNFSLKNDRKIIRSKFKIFYLTH